ncbi:caspase domain-containing protein [Streptomyces fagopyri]|uniref:caspase family protein n=1 Tax=Streptomyces fagopyri TaxID=2662397 RepID=UPI0036C3FBF7
MAGEYRALLIGVHQYCEDSDFGLLKGPPNDLREMDRVLRDPVSGLFTVKGRLLNPKTGDLRIGVQKFLDGASRDDHLLLYYSGHGETSSRKRQLCLTSAESSRATLDSSGLSFDECYEWITDSPARSVTVILDCCRSGVAVKSGGPDFGEVEALFSGEEEPQSKTVKVLAAGTGYQTTADADSDDGTSPFTARLIAALTDSAQADELGLVSFDSVVAAMKATQNDSTPRLQAWGTHQDGGGPYLAQRAGHARHAMEQAGLKEMAFSRRGGAEYDGRTVHVRVAQVERIATQLADRSPTTMFVSGPLGTGKTWILCDVIDRLTDEDWEIRTFLPSREPEDAHKLLTALRTYAAQLRASTDKLCLVVIDGIEWSDIWAEFVIGLQDLTERDDLGVGVLASLEIQRGQIQPDHEHKSWQVSGDRLVQPVVARSATEFIAEVLSAAWNPHVADWSADRLNRARNSLQELIGTDLWAATRLGPLWHASDAEEQVIRAVWEERLGPVSPAQSAALRKVAALGRFNLWCPLADALNAGDALVRLGPEFSERNEAVRLNSGFLCRAILARRESGGRVSYSYERRAADPVARQVITQHLSAMLLASHRQKDVITTLSRLRYDRRVFTDVVRKLSQGSARRPSAWDTWAEGWEDLAPVVHILSYLRTALPPAQAGELGDRLCQHVVDHAHDDLPLPVVVAALELLRDINRGRRRPAAFTEARDCLTDIAERQLAEHRWPAALRRRLLRLLRQMKWLTEENIERVGPLLLRPASPSVPEDLKIVFDFVRTVSRGRTTDALRAALATWDVVTEDLVRAPEEGNKPSGPERLAVRGILARYVYDEEFADDLLRQLMVALRKATAWQLNETLVASARLDKRFAADIVGRLDVDTWSTSVYRNAPPIAVAKLLSTLGNIRADIAVRTLYRADGTADTALADELAAPMRDDGDAVSASMLLKAAVRCEEQRGLLEGGFAQYLSHALGADFLADTLAHNTRLTIVNHLVEGYAKARTPLIESVRDEALCVVEDQIEHSGSEVGPRLALILSDEDALGQSFVTELITRGVIRRSTILARMLHIHNPGALAAFHELGVALFPGIETDFVNGVEASGHSWTQTRMFDNLADEGNVILALRAARSVAATLVLSGRHDAGGVILDAYQRAYQTGHPGQEWSRRVLEADDIELAEGIRLLRSLRAADARRVTEENLFRLSQAARRSSPRVLADLLAAVAEVSSEAGERLFAMCQEAELLNDAFDDLIVDGDLFSQAASLYGLTTVEDRLYTRVVPTEMAERFHQDWTLQIQVINNPGLVQTLMRVAGNSGPDAAVSVARAVNIGSLRRRLERRNRGDAGGFTQLISILAELTPHLLSDLVDLDDARWLMWEAPMNLLGGLAESLAAAGVATEADISGMLALRLNVASERVPRRQLSGYLLGAGWAAWTMASLGGRLRLDHMFSMWTANSVVPQHLLWALAWFEQDAWMQPLMNEAFEALSRRDGPPESPGAAAAILTVCEALDREPPRYNSADSLASWGHALRAEPAWIRALLASARQGGRVHTALRQEWAPWGTQRLQASLRWRAHDWRSVPGEALSDLLRLTRDA